MNDLAIYEKVVSLKKRLLLDGFVIDGIFGSYARDEQDSDSDVDILYHLDKKFYEKYEGFVGFGKLDEIKKDISEKLGKKVDFAPKNNLSKTAKKYILQEVVYV